MSMMIHHITVEARHRLLEEVSRVLKTDGVLVLRDNDAILPLHSLMLDIQHGVYACARTNLPEMSVAAFVSEFKTAYVSAKQIQREALAVGLHTLHLSRIRDDQFRKFWMVLGPKQPARKTSRRVGTGGGRNWRDISMRRNSQKARGDQSGSRWRRK
eukprot:gnl/Dysnectes_brevis/7933_a13756_364.p1 GENE.gnl/Dysnectes_brevis/7933_a13756_364~~gnl/Dysnectes_brevis/7933_a13756_364.p1  ORF type:complete len:157 (-),score=17.32 gnl/Dysnectes_brevis/7933_a13756_364:56-526(-)